MLRLGSTSKTRAMLLNKFGVSFKQEASNFNEDSITTADPKTFVYEVTKGKLNSCLKQYGIKDYPLLVADTVIVANNKLLRKAKNKEEARRILNEQSGSMVSIITCMIYKSTKKEIIDIAYTDYEFLEFNKKDIENYLNTNDWQDKAGACMVEGFCKKYIKSVKGKESTAMGLSVENLLAFL
jgi:septum formation protein